MEKEKNYLSGYLFILFSIGISALKYVPSFYHRGMAQSSLQFLRGMFGFNFLNHGMYITELPVSFLSSEKFRRRNSLVAAPHFIVIMKTELGEGIVWYHLARQ